MPSITTHSTGETRALGADTARAARPGSVIALKGDLGAGKTTFVQGFLEALGAEGPYVSPTFVIMKEYDLPETLPVDGGKRAGLAAPSATDIRRVYHMDAYRIDDPEEIARLGFEEWIADPQGIVLVEWPEKIESLLPADTDTVSLRWVSDTEREVSIEHRILP